MDEVMRRYPDSFKDFEMVEYEKTPPEDGVWIYRRKSEIRNQKRGVEGRRYMAYGFYAPCACLQSRIENPESYREPVCHIPSTVYSFQISAF